jgi:transposase
MSTRRHRTLFRYPPIFKLRAVEVTLIPGVRSAEVARALQIHPKMLGLWRAQARKGDLLRQASQAPRNTSAARRRQSRVLNAELERERQEQAEARLREVARWFMDTQHGGRLPGALP